VLEEIVTWRQRAERCPWCGNYSLTIDVYNAEDGLEERCRRGECASFGKDISTFGRELLKERVGIQAKLAESVDNERQLALRIVNLESAATRMKQAMLTAVTSTVNLWRKTADEMGRDASFGRADRLRDYASAAEEVGAVLEEVKIND
jgi:hypothetical protein